MSIHTIYSSEPFGSPLNGECLYWEFVMYRGAVEWDLEIIMFFPSALPEKTSSILYKKQHEIL